MKDPVLAQIFGNAFPNTLGTVPTGMLLPFSSC